MLSIYENLLTENQNKIIYNKTMNLSTPLSRVLKTKREYIEALDSMNLKTIEDLLLYFPRTHEDISTTQTLTKAPIDTKVTIRGNIHELKLIRTRSKKKIVKAKFVDVQGDIAEVVWFNQPHIMRMLTEGEDVALTGKLKESGYKLQFQSPQFEKPVNNMTVHGGRLVPVYPQHDIITSKWLREKMLLIKDAINLLPETLPADVIKEEELLSRAETIKSLHFPESSDQVQAAKQRLEFEQMYELQKEALKRKREWQGETQERLRIPMDIDLIKDLFASLKFTPTNSQKIAIYEILKDMEREQPMSRLLEGDVGSGKTLVATTVMANTIKHKGQCALMVPTEVLARQHVVNIGRILTGLHNYSDQSLALPRIALLTGSIPKKQADDTKQKLLHGEIDLVIGTHALITDNVVFRDLKLVIVDEQHRFGVVQREKLKEKGNPHFMAMTATPIPRTLALTAYGHHDLSVLLEKPGNRQPVETRVVSPKERKTVENFIDHQIQEGRQVFVICPLIQESENEDMVEIKSVQQETARLKEGFSHRRIAMLHGKMAPKEKQDVMEAFKARRHDLLVSTSVIEVGIDVPNSTIIIIEGSERFGLAQLHQFRGRVGRGEHKSYCFLFTTTPQQARSPRLKAMEQHTDGFTLAEIDLQIRGPGEIYGVRQSGIPESSFSGLMNPELVVRARRAAEKFLHK